jgi:hypothetical protein
LCISFAKTGLGFVLGHFFTNSSGRHARRLRCQAQSKQNVLPKGTQLKTESHLKDFQNNDLKSFEFNVA